MALAWIDDYNSRPHSGKGMNGRTPRQVFDEERNPRQKPTPAPDVLALMLAEHKPGVMVRECSVQLAKHRYIGNDAVDAVYLHNMNGRKVTLAYDPNDMEEIAVLDLDGRLMAWARMENFVTHSAEAGPAIAASMRQRRRMERDTREQIRGFAVSARANGARSDLEHLAMRAGVLDVPDVITQRRARRLGPDSTATAPKTADEIATEVLALMKNARGEDAVSDMVTQRRARLLPDNAAVAPISAAEIARQVLRDDDEVDEVVTQRRRARLRADNLAVAPLTAEDIAQRFLKDED